MADIQYLNYGDLQIELLALLTNLANNVQDYVNNLSWSTKRKEKFMSAYSDLMNHGILGASNSTGLWTIKVKGEDIPFETMSKKDKEMYEEAAYFIQQQMAGLPTKSSQEEEAKKKKEELPVFDNFDSNFKHYVGKTFFGGNNFNIGGELDEWNYLDERDPNTGLRGTTKRAKKLAEYLQSYSNSLKEDLYNFENSPFLDLNDLKTRIGTAIQALKTSDPNDDRGALNAIGLKSADWFYNGSGDAYKNGEYEGTYGDYYNTYLPTLERKKQEEETAKLKAQQEEYLRNKLYFTTHKSKLFGKDLNYLANKYLNELNLVTALNDYVSRGIGNLNGEELSELVGGFKYGALDPISDEELKAFRTYSPVFKNATKNLFRKFRGVEGAFFHVPSGKVYTFGTRDLVSPISSTTGDILKGRSDKDKLQAYLQNTEFTDADWAELAGIGLDIASIVDPEPWSAGTMGVLAAGARNYARALQPEDWGFLDYLSQGADYVTGALGAAPLLGDSVLLAKVVKSAGPWLRKAMRVPAFLDLWNSTPGMVDFGKKLLNGETDKLTVEDWRNFGTFVRGLATTRNLNVTNRAARRALEKRGIETTNKWHLKWGLTRTKPLSETTTPTIRVKVGEKGKVEDIPITTAERKARIEEELRTKGKDEASRADVLKNTEEVKKFATDNNIKLEDIHIVLDKSTLRALTNARIFGTKWGILPSNARSTRGIFGEIPTQTTKGNDDFDNYIKSSRGFWDRFAYGSNRTLRGMDKLNHVKYKIPETQNAEVDLNPTRILEGPTPLSYRQSQVGRTLPKGVRMSSELPENVKLNRETLNEYKNTIINSKFSNNELLSGTNSLAGIPILVVKLSDGTFSIIYEGNIVSNERSLREIQKLIRNLIKSTVKQGKLNSSSKTSAKEMGKLLKEFKAKGWLKRGGTIDRQRIQRYKEYINK